MESKKKYLLLGILIGFCLILIVGFISTKFSESEIQSVYSDGIISQSLDLTSGDDILTNKINDKEINITIYSVVASEKINTNDFSSGYLKEIDNGYKFGFNITVPEDSLSLTPFSSNLQEVVFNITSEYPIEEFGGWFRFYLGERNYDNINIRDYAVYNFNDILDKYQIQKHNQEVFDKKIYDEYYNVSIPYSIEIIENNVLVKFNFSGFSFSEGEIIELDPTVTLAGDVSYASTDQNVTQEPSFAHLETSPALPFDLIMYMPFDINKNSSTTYDYTKNNNDGTLVANTAYSSTGYIGGSYEFDGTGDYIQTTASIKNSKNFTWSVWIENDDDNIQATERYAILWEGDPAGNGGGGEQEAHLNLGDTTATSGNYLQFFVEAEVSDIKITHSIGGGFTDWHHVAVVVENFDSASPSAELYLDGVSVGTDTAGGSIKTDDWQFKIKIGCMGDNSRCFDGEIDEVMVFNQSLTSSQILQIYNNQSARFRDKGIMNFTNQDISGAGDNENKLNISIREYHTDMGTNISFRVNAGAWANFSINASGSGNILDYNFTDSPVSVNLSFMFLSNPNRFYSPIMSGNITIDSWTTGAPPEDTCDCVTNGNWVVDCTDDCTLSTNCVMQAGTNFTADGSGLFTFNANLSGFSVVKFGGGCDFVCNSGGCWI